MDQHLLYMGQELNNHSILASVGISHGALLNLVLTLRTGPLGRPLACLPCWPHSIIARQPIFQHVTHDVPTGHAEAHPLVNGKLLPFLCVAPNTYMTENGLQQNHSSTNSEPVANNGTSLSIDSAGHTVDTTDDEMDQIAEYLGYAIHDNERIESTFYGNSHTGPFSNCPHISEAEEDASKVEFDSDRRIPTTSQILCEETSERYQSFCDLDQLENPNSNRPETQEYLNSLIRSCNSSVLESLTSNISHLIPENIDDELVEVRGRNTVSDNSTNSMVPSTVEESSKAIVNPPKYSNAFILNPSIPIPPEFLKYQPIILPGGLSPSLTNKLHDGWYPSVIIAPQIPPSSRLPMRLSSNDSEPVEPNSATSQEVYPLSVVYPQWDLNSRLSLLSASDNSPNHSKPEHIVTNSNDREDEKSHLKTNELGESQNPNYSKRPSRCFECNKRTRPACGFSCRCKRWFCSKHHHPEDHKCNFNFKSMTNPMLVTVPSQLPP